jgi:hypothetical protein
MGKKNDPNYIDKLGIFSSILVYIISFIVSVIVIIINIVFNIIQLCEILEERLYLHKMKKITIKPTSYDTLEQLNLFVSHLFTKNYYNNTDMTNMSRLTNDIIGNSRDFPVFVQLDLIKRFKKIEKVLKHDTEALYKVDI